MKKVVLTMEDIIHVVSSIRKKDIKYNLIGREYLNISINIPLNEIKKFEYFKNEEIGYITVNPDADSFERIIPIINNIEYNDKTNILDFKTGRKINLEEK